LKRLLPAVAAVVFLAASAPAAATVDTSTLRADVTVDRIMHHLTKLQQIADRNDGTRASGLPGFAASEQYVADQLRDQGYIVTIQPFQFAFFRELATPTFERTSPQPHVFAPDVDFFTMTYSGSGNTTARIVPVDTNGQPSSSSTSGCEAGDFATFPAGAIALMQRGSCTFATKAQNAFNAHATAAVIFNSGGGNNAAFQGTLGAPGLTIPALGTSFPIGQEFYNLSLDGPVMAHVQTTTEADTRTTSNVIAETPGGNPNKIVVAGAHLDSVTRGPGIVDNGSGIATQLEIAKQLHKSAKIDKTGPPDGLINKVRFAFWGSEENGLNGSAFYVSQLSPAERAKITININVDMLASSNGVYFVQDGDGAHVIPPGPVRPGRSVELENVLVDYFTSQGLPWVYRPYDGRSDYMSFINAGIGAGGLTTGSDQVKTAEQVALFGGTAGLIMHPCYHAACDRLDTVNVPFLDDLSDADAHAILTFAQTP
jgi:Zn-dependent M28 family amino/carboxypeptidase